MPMLTDLADVLRAAGLRVEEVPGWKTNARPASSGGFNPRGNLWHHTGAKDTNPLSIEDDRSYARWLADVGRLDLPAPLCQLSVGRNGTIYVCAAGRGNHAGTARASGPMPSGDGNYLYLGWECQNSGSEGWTREQYDAMVRGAAATSKHYGWAWNTNRAHKETSTTGKWDPGLLDMDKFRRDIRAALTEGFVMDKEAREAFAALNEKVDGIAADVARSKQFLAFSRKRELLTNKRLKSLGITAEQIQAVLDEAEAGGSGEG